MVTVPVEVPLLGSPPITDAGATVSKSEDGEEDIGFTVKLALAEIEPELAPTPTRIDVETLVVWAVNEPVVLP
jgi:hypothetical protein